MTENNLLFLREETDPSEMKVVSIPLTEEEQKIGKKQEMFIQGPMLVGNSKNKNGRVYDTDKVLVPAVEKYAKERINGQKGLRAAGELNHPSGPEINLERISHYITELKMEGDVGYGKAKIASTATGEVLRNLVSDGYIPGMSTRGLGKLDQKGGVDYVSVYEMVAIDAVHDPSAPGAFVEAVMEGLKYYIKDNGEIAVSNGIDQVLEEFKKKLDVLPSKTDDKNSYLFDQVKSILNSI
jgi:hypothetical protein